MTAGEWLQTHTFHHEAFCEAARLVEAKQRQNLRISLCIPTLDEERTIGEMILRLKEELMQQYPLIDEFAIIDSGSSDATREVARAHGAEVYFSGAILPAHGFRQGKGENLWKSLYQLTGDILVFLDGDIRNIHPRFVHGLLGPLLDNPSIQYVKGFYDRPLSTASGEQTAGGGRVTEILVRPLLSLFFPELSSVIQPLSGEYAARRTILETIPFPVGYGVEMANLLDIHHRHGLNAIAQTDLEQRLHRNRSTGELGKMAFAILQTFLRRLERFGMVESLHPLSRVLHQFESQDSGFRRISQPGDEEERPPMASLSEYRARFPACTRKR